MRKWNRNAISAALLGTAVLAVQAQPATTTQNSAIPVTTAVAFVPHAAPEGVFANERAQALVEADPRVTQARAALESARHRAQALAVGPYEWVAKASSQQRRYDAGRGSVREWSVGMERTVRIGGKAAMDRELAELAIQLAMARLAEARHESARDLLELTVGIQAAERTKILWMEQLTFARANADAAAARQRAGDASRLDQNVAAADLAEVQRQVSTAASEEAKLRARFTVRYGSQPIPALAVTDPTPLVPDIALWRSRIVEESDVVKVFERELRQAEVTARRAGADRLADPTVGVYTGSEGGGTDRLVGLSLSIPLGGTYRSALQREALQQVEVARAALDRSRQDVEAEVAQTLAEATGSLERWRFAEQAAQAAAQNARLTQRAYSLGESDQQAVLLARRQSVEAALGAAQARTDALRARYRLMVDAHLIWRLHED